VWRLVNENEGEADLLTFDGNIVQGFSETLQQFEEGGIHARLPQEVSALEGLQNEKS
jgi:hypothetical protein